MGAEAQKQSILVPCAAGAGLFLFLVTLLVIAPRQSQAVPAFATQTGQPCSACHVGAFGPQLKQTGRDFKMFGYINTDGGKHFPPIAVTSQTEFTHTEKGIPGGAAPGFKDNNNVSQDQTSIYYAGKITEVMGAFSQWTYDGVAHKWGWDNQDFRVAGEKENFHGHDVVAGITANNAVGMEDIWNSTPVWAFPYNGSGLAPAPSEATLIDGGLFHNVWGVGAYSMWDSALYVDLSFYGNISADIQKNLGNTDVNGSDKFDGLVPYWRLALQHDFTDNYVEVGTYGVHARRYPGGITSAGTDSITDIAFDANYQYTGSKDYFVSAHTTFINEDMNLDANQTLNGTNGSDQLHTLRGDISYSYQNTWTPTFQLFKTWGTSDAALYPGSVTGSPDSAGFNAEIAWVPGGKPNSRFFDWANAKLSLLYTGYTQFEGTSKNAHDNNTLLLTLWLALDPFKPLEHEDECTAGGKYCK